MVSKGSLKWLLLVLLPVWAGSDAIGAKYILLQHVYSLTCYVVRKKKFPFEACVSGMEIYVSLYKSNI